MVQVKRAYAPADISDVKRLLVDRIGRRGIKKEVLKIHGWLRQIAPSAELRKWFNHDAARWEKFKARYFAELDSGPESWKPLPETRQSKVTLLFGAKAEKYNNAVALKEYLEKKLGTLIPESV